MPTTINYNIRAIIISKVALKQWKNRIKTINEEYHKWFTFRDSSVDAVIFNGDPYNHQECKNIIAAYAYNWRNNTSSRRISIHHCRIRKCKSGYLHPMDGIICYLLPKKYWYTSGLNHPTAYKKIE